MSIDVQPTELAAACPSPRPAARKQDGQARHYADMHAAMRGHGIASTSGRDASVRAVEAGSRLVAAPRGADFAVLQLPRGNLETVSPRALVLAALAHALLVSRSSLSFLEANSTPVLCIATASCYILLCTYLKIICGD